MWIARCDGASAGSWARSRSGMRSASARCWPQHRRPIPPPLVAERAAVPDAIASATVALPPAAARSAAARHARRSAARVVKQNAGASLVDLGDGVLAVEFHSKMNTDRRRHAADAARRRQGSRGEFLGAGHRQRRAEFFGRRQPDAAAARGAGRQLGRDRSDGPDVPGRDAGAALCGRAGGGLSRPG